MTFDRSVHSIMRSKTTGFPLCAPAPRPASLSRGSNLHRAKSRERETYSSSSCLKKPILRQTAGRELGKETNKDQRPCCSTKHDKPTYRSKTNKEDKHQTAAAEALNSIDSPAQYESREREQAGAQRERPTTSISVHTAAKRCSWNVTKQLKRELKKCTLGQELLLVQELLIVLALWYFIIQYRISVYDSSSWNVTNSPKERSKLYGRERTIFTIIVLALCLVFHQTRQGYLYTARQLCSCRRRKHLLFAERCTHGCAEEMTRRCWCGYCSITGTRDSFFVRHVSCKTEILIFDRLLTQS